MKTSQNLTDAYASMGGTLGSYASGGTFQDEPFPLRGELEHQVPIAPNVPGPVPARPAMRTLPHPISANCYWASRTVEQPDTDLFVAVTQEKN